MEMAYGQTVPTRLVPRQIHIHLGMHLRRLTHRHSLIMTVLQYAMHVNMSYTTFVHKITHRLNLCVIMYTKVV